MLSVDRKHHVVQIVDSAHVVHAYHYSGNLGAATPGTHLSFRHHGSTLTSLKAVRGQSVTFLAKVVRASKGGVVLSLGDGHRLSLGAGQLHRKPARRHGKPRVFFAHVASAIQFSGGGVTVNISGLEPGLTVLVTESTDATGALTITLTLPAPSTPSVQGEQASGTVVHAGQDAFLLGTADGSLLHLHMARAALATAGLQSCDLVEVTYHQDNDLLIVDSVKVTGTSTSGDCQGGTGDSGQGGDGSQGGDGQGGGDQNDTVGTVTAVSGSGVTLSTTDGTSITFVVGDPSITDGFAVGDLVDVTYSVNGSELDASDVEFVEQDVTGTVTSVSDGSLTLSPDDGSAPQTFSADPTQGVFQGVASGDSVDVTFHQSGGQQVADTVSELAPLAPPSDGSTGTGGA